MRLGIIILTAVLLGGVGALADGPQPLPLPPDSIAAEAASREMTLADSIHQVFPDVDLDTLSERQRSVIEFETRFHLQKQQQEAEAEVATPFSYYDTLLARFVTERWNLRSRLDRSFYHDAGDYFRSEPAFFIQEPQVTPMRKTVQPYGLSGDRLGFLIGGRELDPFEHVIEPDGLTDLNDIPTALDDRVAILPGPVGLVFGGAHSVATLLTVPKEPDSATSASAFLVDKGSFGFSHARGRYSGRFSNGRKIDMSIGYRNADGPVFGRDDDAYQYTADMLLPIGAESAVRGTGWLYDRNGHYLIRPNGNGTRIERDRFDRFGQLSLIANNAKHTARTEVGYRHTRRASSIDEGGVDEYRARCNFTGHGGFAAREWTMGRVLVSAGVSGDYIQYDDRVNAFDRAETEAELGVATVGSNWALAARARQQWVEGFRFLPTAAAMAARETEHSYLMFSGGYSERAPSLHELHQRYQEASIYSSALDYADRGNPALKSERQWLGACEYEVGTTANAVGVAVAGGMITDGIDWTYAVEDNVTVFSPVNGDVDFATVSGEARLSVGELVRLVGGASYHYLEYELFEDKAYSPEYQAFSGLEVHLFWPQKLMHFWGYGEIVYTGPYHGYVQENLGEEPIINIKLSFKMGNFRFHWISQNVLSNPFFSRDYFISPGRFNSYGFTWDFID